MLKKNCSNSNNPGNIIKLISILILTDGSFPCECVCHQPVVETREILVDIDSCKQHRILAYFTEMANSMKEYTIDIHIQYTYIQ